MLLLTKWQKKRAGIDFLLFFCYNASDINATTDISALLDKRFSFVADNVSIANCVAFVNYFGNFSVIERSKPSLYKTEILWAEPSGGGGAEQSS